MELSLFFLELISEWIVYYMTSPTIRSINEIIGKIVPILIGVILILIINYKKLCIKMDKRKSIAKKYSKLVHIGEKRALHEFPMFLNILKKPSIQKELKLTEDEIDYLRN